MSQQQNGSQVKLITVKVAGFSDYPCFITDLVGDVVNGIRSENRLEGGGIRQNGLSLFEHHTFEERQYGEGNYQFLHFTRSNLSPFSSTSILFNSFFSKFLQPDVVLIVQGALKPGTN